MQYSSALLALLAATGALAAPSRKSHADTKIKVFFDGNIHEATKLQSGFKDVKAPKYGQGPFKTIELKVGQDVENRDAYRCAIFDDADKPIVATRGANIDVNFSDAGNGPWTFKQESKVKTIVCDPTLKKTGPEGKQIRVILSDQATETGSQTTFDEGDVQPKAPVGSTGPFETVEISVGVLVENQGTRCQLLDHMNHPIVATRGANTDTTFSDADKGEWTFGKKDMPVRSKVSSIVCDPKFVAMPQPQ